MLKNERKINYMVGLAGKGNDHHRSWTGIKMNFWPLVHPCLFHPPTTLPPLQVDSDKVGADSDHDVVVLAPICNSEYRIERKKKSVVTRPLPESQMAKFETAVMSFNWDEAFLDKSVDEKVDIFHSFLRSTLDQYFPEKTTKMSNFDKAWMSPQLKQLHRAMQREFIKHRKSKKHKKLKSKFKKLKRNTVKTLYSGFVSDLKVTNPGKWYHMAKKIGAVDKMSGGDIHVESLSNFDNAECANKIAEHFASVSNEYSPVNNELLPCYLPALPPPQVTEHDVYLRLEKMKKTKSTLPIDIPEKLRRECSPHLAAPMSKIINDSLNQSVYPSLLKHEWVTPAPNLQIRKKSQIYAKYLALAITQNYMKVLLKTGSWRMFLQTLILDNLEGNLVLGPNT